jgi:type IV pilus assembly protein PilC
MNTIIPLLVLLVPLVLTVGGVLVLWHCYRELPTAQQVGSLSNDLGKVTGWCLLLLGLFALLALMTGLFFLVAWVAAAIVLVSMLARYRETEQESLLWMLMVAAERNIPLESAARAFADERNDSVGLRARRLAEYLEAGVPLALALQRTQHRLSPATLLAADLGQQTGRLAPALRQVVTQSDDFDRTFRSMLEKIFYLGFLIVVILLNLGFLMLKIVPVFERIMVDFQTEIPTDLRLLVSVSGWFVNYWFIFSPVWLVIVLLLLSGLLYYMGVLPHRFPILRGIWWRVDCAWVMRWLADGVRQKRPIAESVRLLSGYFPQPRMRAKLAWAAGRIDQGADWCESLQLAGVFRKAERAVFKSAERVGNLPWALEEMAEGGTRRMALRLRTYISIAFPMIVVLLGVCVACIERGILVPLVSLIHWLV